MKIQWTIILFYLGAEAEADSIPFVNAIKNEKGKHKLIHYLWY